MIINPPHNPHSVGPSRYSPHSHSDLALLHQGGFISNKWHFPKQKQHLLFQMAVPIILFCNGIPSPQGANDQGAPDIQDQLPWTLCCKYCQVSSIIVGGFPRKWLNLMVKVCSSEPPGVLLVSSVSWGFRSSSQNFLWSTTTFDVLVKNHVCEYTHR